MTKNLMDTILAINPIGPNFGHGPPWTNSSAMASGNHQRPQDQLSPSFPSTPGDFFLSFIPSVLKVDPISPFQIKVPNPNAQFEGGLISSSV
ncbi:hypothetical protein O181_109855 [Austropuccinia psidii MF-1]|uniref:Uncharacterized protein n=1 Tax=Austropuccinia psidii MF-1 TaxID=1389203 RepID=A0A9Q3PQY6_9BASI|nr:hypothetical protein [Austropuccinia psidii MF-1]